MVQGQDLIIEQVLAAWNSQSNQFNTLINSLSDEQLSREISPGKNTGVYLFGHLIAVNDGMLPILGYGEKLFPDYEPIFITNPDKSGLAKPSIPALRQAFETINSRLTEHIWATSPASWLQKHTAVSDDAFANEPHRNKLNVMINRTGHLAYHLGQLTLLKT